LCTFGSFFSTCYHCFFSGPPFWKMVAMLAPFGSCFPLFSQVPGFFPNCFRKVPPQVMQFFPARFLLNFVMQRLPRPFFNSPNFFALFRFFDFSAHCRRVPIVVEFFIGLSLPIFKSSLNSPPTSCACYLEFPLVSTFPVLQPRPTLVPYAPPPLCGVSSTTWGILSCFFLSPEF